ncbi:hypothetical protein ABPG74_018657 [Tetrahymena malaccensis]
MRYTNIIVASSITLMTCIFFPFQAIDSYISEDENLNTIIGSQVYQILMLICCDFLPQIFIGITVDIFSLKSSLIFSVSLIIIGLVVNIFSLLFQEQITILSYYFAYTAYICTSTCVQFIVYDSAYSLQHRMQNIGLFYLFYYLFSKITISFITIFKQMTWITNLIIDSIAIGLTLVCIIVIYKSYKKIDQERQQSIQYQNFQKYQGVGITIKSIVQYYNNQHTIYLFTMTFLTSMITSHSFPDFFITILQNKKSEPFCENAINLIYIICIAFPGFWILYYINTKQPLIQYWMKFTSYFLSLSIIIQILLCLIVYFKDRISYNVLFAIFTLITIYQSSFHLMAVVLYTQILLCFLDKRMSIKCIGLALMSIGQDINLLIFVLDLELIITCLVILLIIVLAKLYHEYYLFNKQFQQLEDELNRSLIDQM